MRDEFAAWLVLTFIAFNLGRAAAFIIGPAMARATTPRYGAWWAAMTQFSEPLKADDAPRVLGFPS
jgi:hypothetical protein